MSSILPNNTYWYMDEKSIDVELKCRLCSKPFVDPVTVPSGDTFCRSCVSHISKKQILIPVTDRLVLKMLDILRVRCQKCNQEDIQRGQLSEHEKQVCTQATVSCTAEDIKCEWKGTRAEFPEHSRQCKFEPLRPALEDIFNEHHQLRTRIQQLEKQINEHHPLRTQIQQLEKQMNELMNLDEIIFIKEE